MWVYCLTLSDRVGAGQLRDDWETSHPPVGPLGVTRGGLDAVIVSTPRAPNYDDFASQSYVDSISEEMELPNQAGPNWDPPYDLHPSGTIQFTE